MMILPDYPSSIDHEAPTAPMQSLKREDPAPPVAAVAPAPGHSKLQRAVHISQITFYVLSVIVITGGALSGLAMHFGWLDLLPQGKGTTAIAGVSPAPITRTSPAFVLAQDTFARPDQVFWGVASDGQTWGGDANSDRAFAISGATGTVVGGQGFFTALLGAQLGDAEVQDTLSISRFDHLRANMGAVLRWRDENNYYKAYLDGQSLVVMRRVAGTATTLGAVPLIARGGVAYTLRFRAVGSQLFVMAWPAGGPEPVAWMLVVTDHSLQVGFGGLRVLLQPGVTVQASAFLERSLS